MLCIVSKWQYERMIFSLKVLYNNSMHHILVRSNQSKYQARKKEKNEAEMLVK